jgi:hypothetical protein
MTKPGLPWREYNATVLPHLREVKEIAHLVGSALPVVIKESVQAAALNL